MCGMEKARHVKSDDVGELSPYQFALPREQLPGVNEGGQGPW